MPRMFRRISAIAATAALFAGVPAQAMCWGSEDVAAAKVRDMAMLLATVSTRCEAAGLATGTSYADFAAAHRLALATANQRLKARFWTISGQEDGQRAYDAYLAALDAPYRKVPMAAENCAQVGALAREAAGAGATVVALAEVAARNHFTPALPGGVCPAQTIRFASRTMSMEQ